MNAQHVLVSRLSHERVASLAAARPDVDTAVRAPHARTVRPALSDSKFGASRHRTGASDVRDLIAAAGPLSLRDIAGGLGVSTSEATALLRSMVEHDGLRQDEWARYRLPTATRM
jgi:hypothetical protein